MKLVLYRFGFVECLVVLQLVVVTRSFSIPISSHFDKENAVEDTDAKNEKIEYNKRFQFMTPNQWVDKWKKSDPIQKKFSFSTPNAWADKWKRTAAKRSFSFSTPNAWADKWKKSLKRSFSFSTPNSWAEQWKRSQDVNDAMKSVSSAGICSNLNFLVNIQRVSQSTMMELLQDCYNENPSSPCLQPHIQAELTELDGYIKMNADIIEWCEHKMKSTNIAAKAKN